MVAPFGISFFALTLIGYILNTYWKVQEVEKNPLKFALFGTYFPLLFSGPIVKYSDTGNELVKEYRFSYQRFAFGGQRILWGLFKKLVISERLSVMVSTIYSDSLTYRGVYVWFAMCLFVLQLYTDFSGCLDVIYGISDLFHIQLPENFAHPFSSRSLSDFWRRWHISLGTWIREYIFFPIMKSSVMVSLMEYLKKKIGKKYGKRIATSIGLFFSWFLVGFWHGGTMNYIFGVGLWMWFVITISELFAPMLERLSDFLNINRDCYSWMLFQRVRTFCLFAFGLGFFPVASFKDGIAFYKAGFSIFNPWVLFDGSVLKLGLTGKDLNILFVSMVIMLIVDKISLIKCVPMREWISNQNFALRWLIWIGLFVSIWIYGLYGPGYNATDFIYTGF